MYKHSTENRSGMVWDDIELSWTTTNIVMPACSNLLAIRKMQEANNLLNRLPVGPPRFKKISS